MLDVCINSDIFFFQFQDFIRDVERNEAFEFLEFGDNLKVLLIMKELPTGTRFMNDKFRFFPRFFFRVRIFSLSNHCPRHLDEMIINDNRSAITAVFEKKFLEVCHLSRLGIECHFNVSKRITMANLTTTVCPKTAAPERYHPLNCTRTQDTASNENKEEFIPLAHWGNRVVKFGTSTSKILEDWRQARLRENKTFIYYPKERAKYLKNFINNTIA